MKENQLYLKYRGERNAMLKFGEKRINPVHVIKYQPSVTSENIFIDFTLSNGESEKIKFESEKERNDMLVLLDKYMVSFDEGTIIMPDIPDFPSMLLGGGGEGPGGIQMQ